MQPWRAPSRGPCTREDRCLLPVCLTSDCITRLHNAQVRCNARRSRARRPAQQRIQAAMTLQEQIDGARLSGSIQRDSITDLKPPIEAPVPRLHAEIISAIDQVSKEDWNACACGGKEVNPFLLWEFLHALEASYSAIPYRGWKPQHVVMRDADNKQIIACCPLYLKNHSSGEYVFDHSWAHMAMYAGQNYYPKLQCCVPFTPVTGARILIRKGFSTGPVHALMGKLLAEVAAELEVSGLHMTFNTVEEWRELEPHGFLKRTGIQYHWYNNNNGGQAPSSNPACQQSQGQKYTTFDDFLMSLKQSKRKAIRQERKGVMNEGLKLRRLTGDDLTPAIWDQFYTFYRNTTDHKWGQAYLTREFFHRLGDAMPQHVVLAVAQEPNSSALVAGALNLLGSHALFGRNWGCTPGCWIKHLHFELCYYQAIECAIELGLERVEAGAQGEHKIQRGYLPQLTYSSHVIVDPGLRRLIEQSLYRDRAAVAYSVEMLRQEASPYKAQA
ncbi:hypothetical protein WJX73_004642 [Symbiochloris irregularis]|uniref:GNAT family N-acetyltransferase n=1 Tax=Symbiochloris irregularis TaxID=706552 RepID=A0AAW1NZ46_9CHLO